MFFRKTHKFPRFKNKFDKQSFTIPQNLKLEDNKLFIPKFSNYIKIKVHRKFEGEFVVATISKNNLNQYFVSIITEKEITIPSQVDGNIGIDLGIKDFATLSNGKKIKNPKILKRNLKKIKFLQRQLSKAKKTSNSRNKRKLKLAKYHQKIANIRNDFLHKITNSISNENQIVVLEDLAVRNMMKNHKLAQAISDVSWYQFKRQLDYKCKWKGRSLIVIDRFFPSSKLCSCCKAIKQDLTLDIREWTCDSCDTIHDRDINASINILNQGLKIADGIAVKSEGSCLQ
jgi:putative transposase